MVRVGGFMMAKPKGKIFKGHRVMLEKVHSKWMRSLKLGKGGNHLSITSTQLNVFGQNKEQIKLGSTVMNKDDASYRISNFLFWAADC